MINLPKDTYINRLIPKYLLNKYDIKTDGYKFYLKNILNESMGYLKNQEEDFLEILFIEIQVEYQHIPEELIKNLADKIPYKVLFVINYDGKQNYAIYYDNKVYQLSWGIDLTIDINTKFIKEIYGNILKRFNLELKKVVNKPQEQKDLENKKELLQKKLNKEKSFNKKRDINEEINKINEELKKYE